MSINKSSSISTARQGDVNTYVTNVDGDLKRIFQRLRRTPDITSGSGAPTSTPSRIGNIYVDTTGIKFYMASGHASSGDWKVLN